MERRGRRRERMQRWRQRLELSTSQEISGVHQKEAERVREMFFPGALRRSRALPAFRNQALSPTREKFLLFSDTEFVVICYRSSSKLTIVTGINLFLVLHCLCPTYQS
jgi:hypothetical protein